MLTPVNLLVIDRGMSFTMETPYNKPLGGAETSLALLSNGLRQLSHMYRGQHKLRCAFLTSIEATTPLFYSETVSYNSVDSLPFYLSTLSSDDVKDYFKVVLVNRDFELAYRIKRDVASIEKTIVGVWTHDAYDQNLCRSLLHKEVRDSLDFILFVSEWQRDTFIKYFNVDPEMCAVSPNPADVNLSYKIAKDKKRNKLIYASIPYKGLELLPDIYNLILDKVPDAELEVFSSMKLYGDNGEADAVYASAINRLAFIGGDRVKIHNELLPMPALLREMAGCKVYLHPQLYHETFGMVLVQAQSVGCVPVVGGGGAVKEVLGDEGALISDISTPCNPLIEDLADKAARVLTCPEPEFYGMMRAAENNAAKYDNVKVAADLLNTLVTVGQKHAKNNNEEG